MMKSLRDPGSLAEMKYELSICSGYFAFNPCQSQVPQVRPPGEQIPARSVSVNASTRGRASCSWMRRLCGVPDKFGVRFCG